MGTARQIEQALGESPRLAPDCDPSALQLSPEEGFLLSRIDGRTPWSLLREIAGLPAADVDRCLERWLGEGILVLGDGSTWSPPRNGKRRSSRPPAAKAAEPPPAAAAAPPQASGPAPAAAPQAAADPNVELPAEVQSRILEFEGRLSLSYHELLDVPLDADVKQIKRAYFKLSREFHPDRYFRKELGPFKARLERIFRRLLEAQEMLSDPTARAEMERSLADEAAQRKPAAPAASAPAPSPEEVRRRLGALRRRAKDLAVRKKKAKHYFETGMSAFRAERWLEAAATVRLSIAFDPSNEAYRDSFVDVQRRAHEERAKQLVHEAEAALDVRDYARALTSFEEALFFRPHDAELHQRAARLAWRSGEDLHKAKELAQAACELQPDVALFRRTLGQIYKAAGLQANARRELRRALELEPSDQEARAELAGLGRG